MMNMRAKATKAASLKSSKGRKKVRVFKFSVPTSKGYLSTAGGKEEDANSPHWDLYLATHWSVQKEFLSAGHTVCTPQ